MKTFFQNHIFLLNCVLASLAFLPFSATPQSAGVGSNVSFYEGREFIVKSTKDPGIVNNGFTRFYKEAAETYENNLGDCRNIPFCTLAGRSCYDSLVGMKFKCLNVFTARRYVMYLQSETHGTFIYLFDPFDPASFYLQMIDEPKDMPNSFCDQITLTADKFDNSLTYSSPSDDVTFIKVIENKKVTYYLYLSTIGSTCSRGKGVQILLSNGEKISRPSTPNDIDVDSDAHFVHSAFITLTLTEVAKLKKNFITDFKIYIYEESVDGGSRYQEYLKCLSSKN